MAKAIMIQGTMSNAGKSLLVAALCRIFQQDGYRCAPFKSQNMALNSYITEEGLEMGRAQVMQAEAAKIKPSVLMNPILLKPTSDMGSQVIVNGEVRGNMAAKEYFQYKKSLIPDIMRAYHTLSEQYDIIVLEGAGSPAEINLKEQDIVNMGMAKLAKAPVLLVGDIDRGGVFAQLLGTWMLLEKEEQQMLKGFVINKFRGDRSILEPGLSALSERIGRPFVGVIPYIDCDIEEEDSLSERLSVKSVSGIVDIAVIRLPKLSNFTDFDVFRQYKGVSVRYPQTPQQLKTPDLILIPGTKNTIADMKWLRESGMEAAIKKKFSSGTPLFGICGGYQMLGKKLSDPEGAEGMDSITGMGILPMETTFRAKKIRSRVQGKFQNIPGIFAELSGKEVTGYEIHMGISESVSGTKALLELSDGRKDGICAENVYGSYLHGIFDHGELAKMVIKALCEKKGISYDQIHQMDREAYKELQYEKLAHEVRKNIDMNYIYQILEQEDCLKV